MKAWRKTNILVFVTDQHRVNVRTLVTERYKLTICEGKPYGEPFDLQANPQEMENLRDVPALGETKPALLRQPADALIHSQNRLWQRLGSA